MSRPTDGAARRVRIRRDDLDGTIIEAGPDSVLGVQPVDVVDAAQVWVDPLDPARLVQVRCPDPAEAAWFLDELLGAGAAVAIVAADAQTSLTPTQVARDIGRIGLLSWLADSSPLPLDQGLLDAELAAAIRAFPGPAAAEQARHHARAALPAALDLAAQFADGAVRPHPAMSRAAYRVAGALLACAAPDDEQAGSLARLAVAARSARTAAAALGDIDRNLVALLESETAPVEWGSSRDRPGARRQARFSVDWRVVPRGILDTRDGTIRVDWTVGRPGVAVSVAGRPGAPEVPLFARVLPADGSGPVGVTALRFDPGADAYRATVGLDGLADGDRVDVFSASASVAPLRGRAAEQHAAGLRCAARAYSAQRLASMAPVSVAPTLWRSAAGDWTEWLTQYSAPASPTADRDRDVVLSALARCQEFQGMSAARRTSARRTDPNVEPDWSDPSASLSLAEGRLLGLV